MVGRLEDVMARSGLAAVCTDGAHALCPSSSNSACFVLIRIPLPHPTPAPAVTLGNIVAGALCMATVYSLAYGSLGKKVWKQ